MKPFKKIEIIVCRSSLTINGAATPITVSHLPLALDSNKLLLFDSLCRSSCPGSNLRAPPVAGPQPWGNSASRLKCNTSMTKGFGLKEYGMLNESSSSMEPGSQ
jgi:hypothetical protein